MIIDELKRELNVALHTYRKNFYSVQDIPRRRQIDIDIIKDALRGSDPILICTTINQYLNNISLPFFSWLTFIDLNNFVRLIKEVLRQPKYQELNLLHNLLKEKEGIISEYKKDSNQNKLIQDESVENKVDQLLMEFQLLKNENRFLYEALSTLDAKVTEIELENKNNLKRALNAEEERDTYKKKYDNLVVFNSKHKETNTSRLPSQKI